MPKRKSKEPETIDNMIDQLERANQVVKEEINNINEDDTKPEKPQDDESKRDELLRLAEDGDLDKSVAYIKKASQKIIDKLYTEYERKRTQKANEFLTDLLISKFSTTLGGLDAIEDPETLTNELKKDELLKRDVYGLVESLTPYIPFLGILSGGVTTAKHVYSHKRKPDEKPDETN